MKGTGYVWKLNPCATGAFFVLTYYGKRTKVAVAIIDADSPMQACRMLADRYPQHKYEVADRDQIAWGTIVHRHQYATAII